MNKSIGVVILLSLCVLAGAAAGNGASSSAVAATLSISKTASPKPVSDGAMLTYTITVTNNGPDNASDVSLTDVVPTSTTFQSFTTLSGGWTISTPTVGQTGTVTATRNVFNKFATATFTLVVKVVAGTPDQTVIQNTATVTSTSDPDPHSATDNTTVVNQLAVDVYGLAAKRAKSGVRIRWRVSAVSDVLGFNVLRKQGGGARKRVNRQVIPALSSLGRYSFLDRRAPKRAVYWVVAIEHNGSRTRFGPVRPKAAS